MPTNKLQLLPGVPCKDTDREVHQSEHANGQGYTQCELGDIGPTSENIRSACLQHGDTQ